MAECKVIVASAVKELIVGIHVCICARYRLSAVGVIAVPQ